MSVECGVNIYNVKLEVDGEEVDGCNEWLTGYLIRNTLLYGISFVISGINSLMRGFLRTVSTIEGKHTETERLASAAQKMWFVQFVNTALIMLAINNTLPNTSWIQKVLE